MTLKGRPKDNLAGHRHAVFNDYTNLFESFLGNVLARDSVL